MGKNRIWRRAGILAAALALSLVLPSVASASEAQLKLPDLTTVSFLGGINGHNLLLGGLVVCLLGLVFGMVIYAQLKKLPVHKSMLEVSELIYATCKTYLLTQLKFILLLWLFIGAVIFVYFAFLAKYEPPRVDLATAVTIQQTTEITTPGGSVQTSPIPYSLI